MYKIGQRVLITDDEQGFERDRKHRIDTLGIVTEVYDIGEVCYVKFPDGAVHDYYFWELTDPTNDFENKINETYEI